ncbi:hypothetical protein [Virgibacillus salexigens]|uniref:Uncharacterized protein n=1 Tax=Virgibacillus kapii TaxID=1638645 RepID=A0ABQ2DDS7_9BACI|nr:hypothetical protein [Virgibacillus kapii]GGJ54486.1 hypothetical protein GCM10007111_15890 [Virgibacillus kapii]
MGLYINRDNHTTIYEHEEARKEPNQRFFVRNHTTEMVKEQQKVNAALQQSFNRLNRLVAQQDVKASTRFKEVSKRLNQLKELHTEHDQVEQKVMQQLHHLETTTANLENVLNDHQLSKQDYHKQMDMLKDSDEKLMEQLKMSEQANADVAKRVEAHLELQEGLVERVNNHDKKQKETNARLENQEALTEKMVRQLDNIRSILFERTNYLAEKIEDGYQLTSSYVTKLMTGDEQPRTLLMMHRNKGRDKE